MLFDQHELKKNFRKDIYFSAKNNSGQEINPARRMYFALYPPDCKSGGTGECQSIKNGLW